MSIARGLQLIHYLIILGCSLLSAANTCWAFQVEKIVSGDDSLKAMSDHNNRKISFLLLLNIQDSVLDFGFTLRVKSGGGLVKHENLRLLDQSSCNSNSLLLASRQVENSAGADISFESFFHLVDEVCVCKVNCSLQIGLSCILVSIQQVLSDGADDQDRLLTNPTDQFTETGQVNILKRRLSIRDAALGGIIETFDHLDNCALSGA